MQLFLLIIQRINFEVGSFSLEELIGGFPPFLFSYFTFSVVGIYCIILTKLLAEDLVEKKLFEDYYLIWFFKFVS